MKVAGLDIETTLNHKHIHCAVVTDHEWKEEHVCFSADELRDVLQAGNWDRLVGHNLIGFDIPVLSDVWGLDIPLTQVYDTLVAGRLLFPSVNKGHSLKEWCRRAGVAQQKQHLQIRPQHL